MIGLRNQHVVGPLHAVAQKIVVALAGDVEHGGAGGCPGGDRQLVQRPRPRERAEDRKDRAAGGEAEQRPTLVPRRPQVAARDRAADDPVLLAASAVDRVGEKDATRKRRRQPVRETEMGVRLRENGRDPSQPGCEHHRPGDVAAGAEDNGRPASPQNRNARERRLHGPHERAHEGETRRAGDAGDLEGVELEARFRNQSRLDAIRGPGECHGRSARAQCFGDGQRRSDVPGCPPRCDHARGLRRRAH